MKRLVVDIVQPMIRAVIGPALALVVSCSHAAPPPAKAPANAAPAGSAMETSPKCDLLEDSLISIRDIQSMAPGEVKAIFVTFVVEKVQHDAHGELVLPADLANSNLTPFSDREADGSLTKDQIFALCSRTDVQQIKLQPENKPAK
jgi:hypothetical protein